MIFYLFNPRTLYLDIIYMLIFPTFYAQDYPRSESFTHDNLPVLASKRILTPDYLRMMI